jgi:hypothetical protein
MSTWIGRWVRICFFEGPAEINGKGFTQKSRYNDPVRGPMEWRSVCALKDDDTMTFEMYGTPKGGHEEKMMEMVYTRKK